MAKRIVSNFKVSEKITETLVVLSATARETKARKPYLQLELFDGFDKIGGNYWDWAGKNIPGPNTVLEITAQVTEWAGNKQLNINSIKSAPDVALESFMPDSGHDIEKVYADTYELASDITNDTLRSLVLAVLEDSSMKQRWLTVPAAKGIHHAFKGGTLVHSYGVAKLAKAIAEQTEGANVDLCIAGALLHDVGKLFTYKFDGIAINFTDEGRLYEHLFVGAEFIGNFAETHADPCNDGLIGVLRHIILSHHGKMEYGSPVTPSCIEAHIVSHADGIDAACETIREAAKRSEGMLWTDRVWSQGNTQHITPTGISAMSCESDLPFV